MNERINQLFEQALEEFEAENKYATIIVPNPLKEKFAELIVRECIEVVGDCSIEYATRPQIMKEIKEHFGVEE